MGVVKKQLVFQKGFGTSTFTGTQKLAEQGLVGLGNFHEPLCT